MASLDQIEGDTVELLALLVVVFIVVAIWLAWRGVQGPFSWLEKMLQALLNWIKNLFQKFEQLNLGGNGSGKFDPFSTGSAGDAYSLQPQSPDLSGATIPLNAFDWGSFSPNDFLVTQDTSGQVPGGVTGTGCPAGFGLCTGIGG